MSGLLQFIERLVDNGEVLLHDRPNVNADERTEVREFLMKIHDDRVLELAGPALEFDAATALAAAELTWRACWFLVSHDEAAANVEEQMRLPAGPVSGAEHFSADLTLIYLPQVHRRANARSPEDVLSRQLRTILRQWPLSGVLSSVSEVPLTPLLFEDHRGLLLLYAERSAQNPKPLWRGEGLTADYCDWIGQDAKGQV